MICIVAHELNPGDGFAWDLAAVARRTDRVILLHSQRIGAVLSRSLRQKAEAAGLEYQHLDEEPPAFSVPIFPAADAHAVGLRLAHVGAVIQADEIWFAGHPAHAASIGGARRCGWLTLAGRKLKAPPALRLFVTTVAEFERTRAGRFPDEGRSGIATEFLERRAIGAADEIYAARNELVEWLQESAWTKAPIRPWLAVEGSPGKSVPPLAVDVAGGVDPGNPAFDVKGAGVNAPGYRSSGSRDLPIKISVCVTYYEKAEYLKEALDTLSVQTLRPHEVIVIDDGSTSPTAELAWKKANDRYWPLGWKFIRQENAGPSAARNRAAREATGDAVLFCDGDNRFRPEMIATLARAMSSSGADCVTCAFEVFRDAPSHIFAPLGPCHELALVENVLGDTNTLFRRDAFLELGGFKPGLVNEDWRLLIDWLRAGRTMETVPAVLFDYRVGATSRSGHEAEFASATAVIDPLLASEPGWRRLWPHIAGALRDDRVARLESELVPARAAVERLENERHAADSARVAAEARAAEAKIEANRFRIIDRMRRAHVVLLEEVSARTREQAADANQALRQARREIATQTETASRYRTDAEGEIFALRGRLGRMAASFSWRITAPLRALRRLLIDRFKPKPEAAAPGPAANSTLPITSHLDAPRYWNGLSGPVTIRGWCFSQSLTQFGAIRARIGARVYGGAYGGERPDLLLVFPAWPYSATAGFKIDAMLESGDPAVDLEAQDTDGVWHPFFHRDLHAGDPDSHGTYAHWLKAHPEPSPAVLDRLRRQAAALPPLRFSILIPVFNPDERWLRAALDSVLAQTYSDWEICIADDASTLPHVGQVLDEYSALDRRIKVTRRPRNGHISAATNTALALATGDWVALFDHDDTLAPHALHCIAQEVVAHPDAALIYTDEDKIDEQGTRFDPHFKPDWNPDLLCSQNYLCHLTVYRADVVRGLGGMREGFEGSQDWDLALRATERLAPSQIRHLPRILYHWRAGEGSTALQLSTKGYVAESARRALAEHFERTGQKVELTPTVGGHWHATYRLAEDRPHPLVSIIIPTHNAGKLVRLCIASIFARTRYAPYEVILVDNRSGESESLAIFAALQREDDVRFVRYDAPFNYSAINNFAAKEARGEVLCLLNNDIEALDPRWLDEMVGHAMRPGIGAVGARLLYPDLRVQHAGVITGLGGVAGHPFKLFEKNDPGTPQFRPHLTQNLSAVTAACLVIRKDTFLAVGGLEEKGLPVAFNDVDFCLRVEGLGLRNVYTPLAELVHHESASRGPEDTPEKVARFQSEIEAIQARWGARLLNDPAYNPNLSLDSEDFALAYPPRVPPL
ncbi:MAG TPA: glycosyltransferase [Opitutaceae bacterium]|jgi:glycosyltransferase involved in cell wall biosynthesis